MKIFLFATEALLANIVLLGRSEVESGVRWLILSATVVIVVAYVVAFLKIGVA